MAGRLKVIDLAKELGVTSKDLLLALDSMGHKGKRAMTPLDVVTANELRRYFISTRGSRHDTKTTRRSST